MSLKDLTSEKHQEAENTPFMQSVFAGNMTQDLWKDFCYQKTMIYRPLEDLLRRRGLATEVNDEIFRAPWLFNDYRVRNGGTVTPGGEPLKDPVKEYVLYIRESIWPDDVNNDKLWAHVYVWHMGDLYGGQQIKNLISGEHRSLTFKDPELLKARIRSNLNDSMADEANLAFDYAVRLLNSYEI